MTGHSRMGVICKEREKIEAGQFLNMSKYVWKRHSTHWGCQEQKQEGRKMQRMLIK